MYDIVVAKYNENIDWVSRFVAANQDETMRVFIYDKSGSECPTHHIRRKNIGREGETYLHHICTHWEDGLADYTLFMQGHPFDHISLSDMTAVSLPKPTKAEPFFPKSIVTEKHLMDLTMTPYGLPVAQKMNQYFGKNEREYTVTFSVGAQYVVPKSVIYHRPKAFYQHLLQQLRCLRPSHYLTLYKGGLNDPFTTLDDWTLERLWPNIFGV